MRGFIFFTDAGALYMNAEEAEAEAAAVAASGRRVPRILPIVKDGHKNPYYYFVVPERDPDRPTVCSPITAEVKPFSVGGVQVRHDHERGQVGEIASRCGMGGGGGCCSFGSECQGNCKCVRGGALLRVRVSWCVPDWASQQEVDCGTFWVGRLVGTQGLRLGAGHNMRWQLMLSGCDEDIPKDVESETGFCCF